jgi:hypothetical protein
MSQLNSKQLLYPLSGSFTGSLLGSASYSSTASYALNGGTGVGSSNLIFSGSVTASVNTGTGNVFSIISGSSPTTLLVVSSSGNVGIGTTTPSYKLDIVGNGPSGSLNANNILYVGTSNVGINTTASSNWNLDIRDYTGKLRLGTSNFSDIFTVRVGSNSQGYSDSYLNGQTQGVALYANPQNLGYIVTANPDVAPITYSSSSVGFIATGPLVLGGGGNEKIRIYSTGDVSIGTQSQNINASGYKLNITGSGTSGVLNANGNLIVSAGQTVISGSQLVITGSTFIVVGNPSINDTLKNAYFINGQSYVYSALNIHGPTSTVSPASNAVMAFHEWTSDVLKGGGSYRFRSNAGQQLATAPYVLGEDQYWGAYNTSGLPNFSQGAYIRVTTTQKYIDTSSPAKITFGTTPSGSITPIERMVINDNGSVAISGSLSISGSMTLQGNLIPGGPYNSNTSSFTLGSPTAAWKDLYIGPGTLVFLSGSASSSVSLGPSNVLNMSASVFGTASYSITSSQAISSSYAATASYVTGSIHTSANPALSASYALTASYVITALTASYVTASNVVGTITSASYALTASFALNAGTTVSTASLLTTASATNNIITFTKGDASTFTVTVATGSGGSGGSTFPFTGSAVITGSLIVTGSLVASGSSHTIIGTLNATSSQAVSSSYALTASYSLNAGTTVSTASLLTTASAASNVITFTKGDASTFTVTVATGSGGGVAFPYTGDASISGSLTVTGSATTAAPLHILSGSTSLLYVSSSGNVGIGTSTNNTYKLDVNGTARIQGATTISTGNLSLTTGLVTLGPSGIFQTTGYSGTRAVAIQIGGTATYKTTNAGSSLVPLMSLASNGETLAAPSLIYDFNNSNGLIFAVGNGTNIVARAGINASGSNNTAGSEAGDLLFLTQTGGTAMSEKMRIFGGGNVAIGTSTDNGYKLYVNGSTLINSTLDIAGTFTGATVGSITTQLIAGTNNNTAQTYRTTNAGGALTPQIYAFNSATAGNNSIVLDRGGNGIVLTAGNGTLQIARAAIQITNLTNTAGSEAGDLILLTQTGGTAMSEKMRIRGNSSILFTSSFTATSTSQSYFQITGSITQVQTASAQIYGVNITPTMIFTTGSQTNTAFRVAPTFSGSAALTSSQQNIIADFGATSVGTQFSVNDITSGSIYMVNDVSGLPIIEALSDWTVNMYNYPTKVFSKTGSAIIISGSMSISSSLTMAPSSSFILPLTASSTPAVGSAYWSGSLLFVYNGTRYMSASFA